MHQVGIGFVHLLQFLLFLFPVAVGVFLLIISWRWVKAHESIARALETFAAEKGSGYDGETTGPRDRKNEGG
ncbi:hypothetical protein C8P63_10753 [Melghirimyces profundicolus]|uniref:Uncharacterized protein n=1 Tax=Melghirimyces profundicolus TaxID=1242148 RepID=A0A2T6BYW6_9BACL|nr:hypothetical protein [Melghirimyces profundicolus]PTX61258.1 hypothetical protein C8P63_10753 [Melghirimyces profundicolus]